MTSAYARQKGRASDPVRAVKGTCLNLRAWLAFWLMGKGLNLGKTKLQASPWCRWVNWASRWLWVGRQARKENGKPTYPPLEMINATSGIKLNKYSPKKFMHCKSQWRNHRGWLKLDLAVVRKHWTLKQLKDSAEPECNWRKAKGSAQTVQRRSVRQAVERRNRSK